MSGAGRGVPPDAEPDETVASAAADHDQQVGPDNGSETSGPAAEGKPSDAAAAGAANTAGTPHGPRHGGRRRRKKRSFWREFPILVVIALLLAVVIKTYAVQAFFIPSGSMENTLEINDRVLVNKLVYDVRDIHRGDIVVFNGDGSWDPGPVPVDTNFVVKFADGFASMFGFGHPGDILIKRVIGLPGDHVACCNVQGQVTVNGVPLSEQSYLYPGDAPSETRFNIVVPSGRLWVMGDHRLISDDSRDHMGDPGGGTVPENAVIGRAFVIIWPPSRWRFLPIPATFEQPQLSTSSAPAAGSARAAGSASDGLLSARLEPAGPALPLSLGFAAAVPLTWLQRRVRVRIARHRAGPPRRRAGQLAPITAALRAATSDQVAFPGRLDLDAGGGSCVTLATRPGSCRPSGRNPSTPASGPPARSYRRHIRIELHTDELPVYAEPIRAAYAEP